MQIIVVLGVIAALIYYILKMRASAKQSDDESDKSNGQGFMNDMFISSNNRSSSYSGKSVDHDDEYDNEQDVEQGEREPMLGDPYDDLEKLAALHEKGILTEEEYSAKKKDILDRI